MTTTPPSLSRPLATAESLGDKAPDAKHFLERKVLFTGDSPVLAAKNGQDCFLDSLLLLSRIVPVLFVYLPASPFKDAAARLIKELDLPRKIEFVSNADYEDYDVILCVGSTVRGDLPWVTVNSNGWMVRVTSGGEALSPDCRQVNPIGSLAAASLGVSEVFKLLISAKAERAPKIRNLSFSFHTYTVTDDPGPEIPSGIPLDLLMVGVGAIGNGVIQLLRSLPVSGSMLVIDEQDFAEENIGTCLLIGSADIGKPKALFARDALNGKLKSVAFRQSIKEFIPRFGAEFPYPRLVVNGLDNVESRRTVQGLWPDLVIDGAISEFACEVTLHPWGKDLSCLMCDFEEPSIRAEEVQSRLTGLSESRLAEPDSVVLEEDVSLAPIEKRPWLRSQVGKKICSVISEATVESISKERQPEGFRPSVPFVACLSSCMIVAELIRYTCRQPEVLETGFQFDVLRGPQFGLTKSHARKSTCMCVQRSSNIEVVRKKRLSPTQSYL